MLVIVALELGIRLYLVYPVSPCATGAAAASAFLVKLYVH